MTLTPAQKQKNYRQRLKGFKGVTNSGKSGPSGKSLSRFARGEFIAIDGEGESRGEEETFEVGTEGKLYKARKHCYTLLAASTGKSLYNGGERLRTKDCLDYLLELSQENPKAIFVIFAGSYDINHILMFGFERKILKRIAAGETVSCVFNSERDVEYEIEYRARKSFTIRKGRVRYQDNKGTWKQKWKQKITVWDVFGFFQASFVEVMKKWLGEDYKHYSIIKKFKSLRGSFENVSHELIADYNNAELETLVAIMKKVQGAINGLELSITRWDGAGSIAGALMRKHKIKQHKLETPQPLVDAVRTAYAGGRIEVCKIGNYKGDVYDYDINSAYPYIMAALPSLASGSWVYGDSNAIPPEGFTLAHLRFQFPHDMPFYPLFYRTTRMQIIFPSYGEGWYWYPEYAASLLCGGEVEVLEWWHFKSIGHERPFHWIEEYYETRKQWLKNPSEEWHNGAEKIIKLGLNSLYGKSAQQIGGRNGESPSYHQLEWAGYITSATRARLYTAALSNPESIIGFATDGVFSIAPLAIESSDKKILGEWDLKIFPGITIAMAGVYWWHHDDKSFTHYSRGFDKDSMRRPDKIIEAWKKGHDTLDIPMQRLIGMGSACTSDTLYKMRGRFTQGERSLIINGESVKREGINVRKAQPHLHLSNVKPKLNTGYALGMQDISEPYPLAWLEESQTDDYKNDLELIRENVDTENI